jgi:hypothetical protein
MKAISLLITTAIFSINVIAGGDNHGSNANSDKYCTKSKDGKLMIMHEGTTITSDVTLANGVKIKTDGSVIKSDGSKMMLKDGECIDKNGKVMKDKMMKDKGMNEKEKSKTPKGQNKSY